MNMDLNELFTEATRLDASDIHLIAGYPPMLRLHGALVPLAGAAKLTQPETEQIILSSFNQEQKDIFLTNKEIDFSLAANGARFRSNVYYQKNTIAADFRLISEKIRS